MIEQFQKVKEKPYTKMAQSQNILVLGAGELGAAMIRGLAQHQSRGNSQISVLLRGLNISSKDSNKQALLSEFHSLGVNAVAGDVVDNTQPELVKLFQPYDLIIGCVGMTAGAGIQTKISRAVCEAGVKRYIPWQFGVDYDAIGRDSAQDLFSEQLDVRDILRGQQSTEWIIVSTGMFTSFLFEPLFGVVSAERTEVRSLGSWENRVTVTTPEDIGRLTAEVVFVSPPIKNEVIFTAGDTVSYAEIADIIEQTFGPVKRIEQTVEFLERELGKTPHDAMAKYRVVFAKETGVSWNKESSFNGKRNISAQTVQEWVTGSLHKS
jgi:hypothetical protein